MGKVHAARQGLHKGSVPLNNFYAADSEAGFNVTRLALEMNQNGLGFQGFGGRVVDYGEPKLQPTRASMAGMMDATD